MRRIFIVITIFFIAQKALTQKTDSILTIPEIQIKSSRSNKTFLSTNSTLKLENLQLLNLGAEAPYLLQQTPSLSFSSDAGNAIGYSNINIRGLDAQRVQVSINGVAYNDPESHQVYWVNIPDLLSSAEDVQVQRGVGYSMLGGTNLGGMISIKTAQKYKEAFKKIRFSVGSFNSMRINAEATTGLLPKGWQLYARGSYITSDGYIDRAFSRLNSQYISLSKFGDKHSQHLILMNGHEKTYQAWYGVESSRYNTERTLNIAGTDYEQTPTPYPNQTDNYTQTHLQWLNNFRLNQNDHLATTFFYVGGRGYYEEYKVGQNLADYAPNFYGTNDIVRQLWLRNHLFGANLQYQKIIKSIENTSAASFQYYVGNHFGKIVENLGEMPLIYPLEIYRNQSDKYEMTIFNKSALKLNKTTLNLDLQLRYINYQANGKLIYNSPLNFMESYIFFNPKIGTNIQHSENRKSYVFLGFSQKEPNRSDFVDAPNSQKPLPEKVLNLEIGQHYSMGPLNIEANLFGMYFIDQLVNTGAINEVGAPIRTNIKNSYRAGLEVAIRGELTKKWFYTLNGSYILSKLIAHQIYTPAYNPDFSLNESYSKTENFSNTDIAYSPRWTFYGEMRYVPTKNLTFLLNSKGVGSQFMDNTAAESRKIPAYVFLNAAAELGFELKNKKKLSLNFLVNNMLNTLTYTHAYTFNTGIQVINPSQIEAPQHFIYLFPQAGINTMIGINLEL